MSSITFNDVLFEPQYSEVLSRSNVDLTSDMGEFKLKIPIIASNMKDICGPKMVLAMFQHGGMGILHRFKKENMEDDFGIEDYKEAYDLILQESKSDPPYSEINKEPQYYFGVSIGVQNYDKNRFDELYKYGARIFAIDIAHGHCSLMKNMIEWIRNKYGEIPCLIAGNIATVQAAKDLTSWGADICKVGIGPGSVCMTRSNTGVGAPQLHALKEIREACPNVKIISDGGIKSTGDIAKALKYANAVMIGSFIAGTSETPGNVYETPEGQFYKVYGGSASGERKVQNGGTNTHVEGVVKMIPFRGHVKYILRKIKENLQSSFSYSGANNLKEFQEKAVLREISGGAKQESKL